MESELGRIARERGHRDWPALLAACEPATLASIELMAAWNLQAEARRSTWQEALGSVVERHGSVYGPWMPFDAEMILGDDE